MAEENESGVNWGKVIAYGGAAAGAVAALAYFGNDIRDAWNEAAIKVADNTRSIVGSAAGTEVLNAKDVAQNTVNTTENTLKTATEALGKANPGMPDSGGLLPAAADNAVKQSALLENVKEASKAFNAAKDNLATASANVTNNSNGILGFIEQHKALSIGAGGAAVAGITALRARNRNDDAEIAPRAQQGNFANRIQAERMGAMQGLMKARMMAESPQYAQAAGMMGGPQIG